jgi:WD40 repeat protein
LIVLSGHDAWVRTIVYSNDGKFLASVSSNGNTIVWKADGNYEQITALKSENIEDLWSVVFSPDNKTLATGGSDAIIKLWDFAKVFGNFYK